MTFFSPQFNHQKKSLIPFVQVYMDGTTTMSIHERKASLREFYGNLLAVLTISAHQSFPLSSLKASYQQRQKLLISIDPDNIQISQFSCSITSNFSNFTTSMGRIWKERFTGQKASLHLRAQYWSLFLHDLSKFWSIVSANCFLTQAQKSLIESYV